MNNSIIKYNLCYTNYAYLSSCSQEVESLSYDGWLDASLHQSEEKKTFPNKTQDDKFLKKQCTDLYYTLKATCFAIIAL